MKSIFEEQGERWREGEWERREREERGREILINGRVDHPQRIYLTRIAGSLSSQTRWLDIGCGRRLVPRWLNDHSKLEAEMRSTARLIIGIDADYEALRENLSCDHKLRADAASLPFAPGCFDLVTSNMVFEHIKNPRSILSEIRRVLKPGGLLIVHTPNWLDIVTIVARFVPNSLHPGLISRMESRLEKDVYPTHFQFNRPRTIEKMLRHAGFNDLRIERLDHPNSYSHVPYFAALESAWHYIARRWPALKGTLLIEARAEVRS
jgi:ubiquinone/menaquinone biosynthesis C-methylase UbiE